MKRVFIIHGWDGFPEEGWFPWLKKELEDRGYQVFIPAMPDPEHPVIEDWVGTLRDSVGEPDANTHFVGHSVGCQTILRYLETLPNKTRVGKVICVAGFLTPLMNLETEEEKDTEKPWIETPIDFEKIRDMAESFICIFSDDDPFVPYEENKKIFEQKLGVRSVLEKGKEHFGASSGISELPIVLHLLEGVS